MDLDGPIFSKPIASSGARSFVVGVAPHGGVLAPTWVPTLLEAFERGHDVVSGMHDRLAQNPELKASVERLGRRLIDVREPPSNIPEEHQADRRATELGGTRGADEFSPPAGMCG
jgi:uncharacterized NAD-dependent epimerase/dehydratase family protein